ncbi:hypothetical protein TNCV_4727841 [Trichonephila clavipes]|nr:hypothetical protein TNCV_4727841 [Trichonephila clavipes]
MGLQFLFMDDNAPCHRTVAAEQLLESEDIERMDWPARSPDFNPIEHVPAIIAYFTRRVRATGEKIIGLVVDRPAEITYGIEYAFNVDRGSNYRKSELYY